MLSLRDQKAFQKKLQDEMKVQGLDGLILTSPGAVYYATGHASNFLYMSGKIGLTMAVVPPEGPVTLILKEFEMEAAKCNCKDINYAPYPVWIYIEDFYVPGQEKPEQPDLDLTFKTAADILLSGKSKPKIGVEMNSIPITRWPILEKAFGKENIVDCDKLMKRVRSFKTPWEITMLRRAAQITETGMYRTAQMIEPGMTEGQIMQQWKINIHKQEPQISFTSQAHTFGEHFAPTMIPREFSVKAGDIVRLDGGPLYFNYRGDLGRSFVVGNKVDPEKERVYNVLLGAFNLALSMIGPGVKYCDVFHATQKYVQTHGLPNYVRGHYGHSIGCNPFAEEYPFISANEPGGFEPGMVFCVEIPYYGSKYNSYNTEDTLLITENGYERFTHVNESLFWR
jgi:Xaa-Pro dipeptidase